MLNWVLQETFCIKEIKEELLQDTEKNTQQIIIKQIETLISRIARPAVDLFLRFPRHDGRIGCMKRYVHEILILDMFYYNENNGKLYILICILIFSQLCICYIVMFLSQQKVTLTRLILL